MPNEPVDLSIKLLEEIRDAVVATNGRVDQTNTRLDQTNTRLGQTNARLDQTNARLDRFESEVCARLDRQERRLTETEIRLSAELAAVVGAIHEVRDVLIEDRQLRAQVSDHETRIGRLERRASE